MQLLIAIIFTLVIAMPALAQPQVSNGELRQAPLSGRLTPAAIAAASPADGVAWVGYAVPAIDGEHRMCCFSDRSAGCCQRCALEPGNRSGNIFTSGSGATGAVALEAGRMLHVLFRLESRRVERIRVFSDECTLDAGGRTVHWLTGVAPADSVALLATFLTDTASRRQTDSALTALAMHREPAALERLLTSARDGATSHLRGQALFWLAQRAGDKAVGAITDAIARDPETEVKRRAVFALSQLPRAEGVPLLIDVARTNRNPAVRKQAMFWLGQSNDPRAVKFFAEILFK